jgi:ABC-type proline/glycine betaine transport system substrate-binding protein
MDWAGSEYGQLVAFVNVVSNTKDDTFDQLNEYKLLNKIIIIIIYFSCKWVFTRWQLYYNKPQHTKTTQTKQSTHTQYDNIHNEYNAHTIKNITIKHTIN